MCARGDLIRFCYHRIQRCNETLQVLCCGYTVGGVYIMNITGPTVTLPAQLDDVTGRSCHPSRFLGKAEFQIWYESHLIYPIRI